MDERKQYCKDNFDFCKASIGLRGFVLTVQYVCMYVTKKITEARGWRHFVDT